MTISFDAAEDLVSRARAGDRDSLDRLLELNRPRILLLVKGVLLDVEEAEDVTQDVLANAARKLDTFDGRASFATWLYRMALNRAISHRRAPRFRFRWLDLDHAQSIPTQVPVTDLDVADALSELSPAERGVLVLHYWEELSLEEIAQVLGIRLSAAKMRLHRARERFRRVYEGGTP